MGEWVPDTFPKWLRDVNRALGKLGRVAVGAANKADDAQATATGAAQTADGKNSVQWEFIQPDIPGTNDGDLWYVLDQSTNAAVGFYRWDATAQQWVAGPLDGSILTNVTAAHIVAGAIDGQVITGVTYRSAATGQRIEIGGTSMKVFDSAGTNVASIFGNASSHQLVLSGIPVNGSDESTTSSGTVYIGANGASAGGSTGIASSLMTDAADLTLRVRTPKIMTLPDGSGSTYNVLLSPGGNSDTILQVSRIVLKTGSTIGGRDFMTATISGGVQTVNVQFDRAIDRGTGRTLVEDTGWVTVNSFQNGYTVRSSSFPVQFRRMNGVVFLRGQLYNSSPGPVAFVLPAGYRPDTAGGVFIGGVSSWDHYTQIDSAGNVSINSATVRTSSTGYPLDGVSFIVP
jgi:hypothetical protein